MDHNNISTADRSKTWRRMSERNTWRKLSENFSKINGNRWAEIFVNEIINCFIAIKVWRSPSHMPPFDINPYLQSHLKLPIVLLHICTCQSHVSSPLLHSSISEWKISLLLKKFLISTIPINLYWAVFLHQLIENVEICNFRWNND